MAREVTMVRNENGYKRIKHAYVGFSWTCLFFGPIVPLLRCDWKWFFISLFVGSFVTCTVAGIPVFALVFAMYYNSVHYSMLLREGYEPLGYMR